MGGSAITDTQTQILRAAERLFIHFGYAKVTMDEIAAAAGLKKASLYYYFPTKDDLFRAVVEPKHLIFEQRVQQIFSEGKSASSRIEDYVDARFDFFKRLIELNVIDIQSMTKGSPVLHDIFGRYARQELQWLRKLFEGGRRTGEFGVPTDAKVADVLLHVMQGMRLRFVRENQDRRPSSASFAQFRRELIFVTRAFLAGLCRSNRNYKRLRKPGRSSEPLELNP